MRENVSLSGRGGGAARGTAAVLRYTDADRLRRAVPIGVGGTLLGLCTIVIPGVHLISTWLIPLISLYVASYFYNRQGAIDDVQFTCPECDAASQSEGGAWEDPMWVRCSACSKPIRVTLDTPMT